VPARKAAATIPNIFGVVIMRKQDFESYKTSYGIS
jgi:hypothetical protein